MPLTIEDVLFLPLYSPQEVTGDDAGVLKQLRATGFKSDFFCPHCGKESTFSKFGHGSNADPIKFMEAGNFYVELHCSRVHQHQVNIWYLLTDGRLLKIGQFPSHADISNPELTQYRKLLGQKRLTELKRACGLISHGVGIGAFTYLRRVFESILWDHHKELEIRGQAIEGYDGFRMEEKIEALEATLPPFLVQNKHLYGILSKGIHELTEDDCLSYFPAVYRATLMILRQDEEQRRRIEEEREAAAELQRISSQLAGKKGGTG